MDNLKRSLLNYFVTENMDRKAHRRIDDQWLEEQLVSENCRIVPMWREMNLFTSDENRQPVFPNYHHLKKRVQDIDKTVFLGIMDGFPCFAVDLPPQDDGVPEQFSSMGQFLNLRKAVSFLDNDAGALLVYAKGMAYWHQCNQFCGKCGSRTSAEQGGHVLTCGNEKCAQKLFPRTDPAIIVLVTNNEKCLLGRQASWPKGMFSTLAGFVEPGESLEGTVVREVFEESGVHINRVYYRSSQPWPFPRSLMVGFNADAMDEDIRLGDELQDARWFSREDIVNNIKDGTIRIPESHTISHGLIKDWFDQGHIETLERLVYGHGSRELLS